MLMALRDADQLWVTLAIFRDEQYIYVATDEGTTRDETYC
jgi:hypothetical protein